MKITFLKQHNDNKKGDTANVPDGVANYLIRCHVAEKATEKKKVEDDKEKKETGHSKEKKHIEKP